MINRGGRFRRQHIGQRIKVGVIGMNEAVNITERHKLGLARIAEYFIHGIGPINHAARNIPIP